MKDIYWWSAVLIVLLIAGFVVIAQIKKRLLSDDRGADGGLTLANLRALHRTGKMSDEEFERARNAVIGASTRAAERQTQPKRSGFPGSGQDTGPT